MFDTKGVFSPTLRAALLALVRAADANPFAADADAGLGGAGLANARWASVHLPALDALLAGQDLTRLPGMPLGAARRRQLDFLAGRLCAASALTQAGFLGVWPLQPGPHGQPIWPPGFTGSITHNACTAMAVAAPRVNAFDLGLDAELVIEDPLSSGVLTSCVHDGERRMLLAAKRLDLVLTVLFSAKEAYYKAVHATVGRFIDFKEVALTDWSASDGSFVIGPAPDNQGGQPWPLVRGCWVERGARVGLHGGVGVDAQRTEVITALAP